MYSDFYNNSVMPQATSNFDGVWIIVSAVLALVGGIAIYVLFTAKKNDGEYTGFAAWVHEFLNFKKYFIDMIIKVLYGITALFITLSSFSFLKVSVATFFLWLILGNVLARIFYEMVTILLTISNNTSEINASLKKINQVEEKPVTKAKKKKEEDAE